MPPTKKPFPTLENARSRFFPHFPPKQAEARSKTLQELNQEESHIPALGYRTQRQGRDRGPRGTLALTVRQVRHQVRHQVTAQELPVEIIVLTLAVLALVGLTVLLEGAASCGDRPVSP